MKPCGVETRRFLSSTLKVSALTVPTNVTSDSLLCNETTTLRASETKLFDGTEGCRFANCTVQLQPEAKNSSVQKVHLHHSLVNNESLAILRHDLIVQGQLQPTDIDAWRGVTRVRVSDKVGIRTVG